MHKLMCRQKKQIKRLQSSLNKLIQSDGIKVDETTNRDLLHIMNCNTSTVLSAEEKFQSLFWQQQLKASSVKGKQGVRWHPAIIRWCLYLHHRSSGAYSTLRNSGVLKLPSERTLRDYRHFASAAAGFTKENDQQLLDLLQLQKTEKLAKYVVITLDEMYIREGLLFDKHSGALIGFADLGNVNNLLAEYEQQHESSNDSFCQRPIAKCMVVFMIRGLFSSLQYVYAQFPALSTKGHQLFVLLWKVIGRLTRLGFEVLAVTCDGAKNNHKMFSMHVSSGQLPYKTTNIHQSTQRTIYFICDPPHVLKTIRNCFARGKLWCQGQAIDWGLVIQLYLSNCGTSSATPGLCLVHKIKREHVFLTSFSKMRVDLAAQVLSETVAKGLQLQFGSTADQTALFIEKMDKLFDCFNVSSFSKGKLKRKPFQQPYRSSDDFRLKFLKEVLVYLNNWEKSVMDREGFTDSEKKAMTLSTETQTAIKISVSSFLELLPTLFEIQGVSCFLSEKLSQDPLEKFFGCQRQKGRANENPSVAEFIKNTQTLRVVNSICVTDITGRGNCHGSKRNLESALDMPLKKRKRRHSK